MADKDYTKKIYRRFSDFIEIAASRELEFFVVDSKFTSSFNYRINKMVDEIKKDGKKGIDISILFNTEGEIALIDVEIIGKFIADNYTIMMEEYYKNAALNKVIKSIVSGSEKSKQDFIAISYNILYKVLQELYKEIKSPKDIVTDFKNKYNLVEYESEDITIIMICMIIMEDICEFLRINTAYLRNIKEIKNKTISEDEG